MLLLHSLFYFITYFIVYILFEFKYLNISLYIFYVYSMEGAATAFLCAVLHCMMTNEKTLKLDNENNCYISNTSLKSVSVVAVCLHLVAASGPAASLPSLIYCIQSVNSHSHFYPPLTKVKTMQTFLLKSSTHQWGSHNKLMMCSQTSSNIQNFILNCSIFISDFQKYQRCYVRP